MVPLVRAWQKLDMPRARASVVDTANAVAILTGEPSGVLVVDVEIPNEDGANVDYKIYEEKHANLSKDYEAFAFRKK